MKPFPLVPGPERLALACALLGLETSAVAPPPRNPQEPRNLVSNGSFENPSVEVHGSQRLIVSGAWTADAGTIELQNRLDSISACEGDQILALNGWAIVSQTCSTQPYRNYSLSFAYSPNPAAAEVSFEVWYADALLETIVVPGGSPAAWSRKSCPVVGGSSRDKLELRCLSGDALGVLIDDCFLIPYVPSSSEQLLRNGNFEDDPKIPPGATLENPVFIGWSTGHDYGIRVQDLGSSGDGYDGDHVLCLLDGRAVSQQVYVVPQQAYQLGFAYSPNPGDDRERTFTVSFDGQILETIVVPRSPAIGWSIKTYAIAAPGPRATVEFEDRSGGLAGAFLDAVTLVGPVPEPETAGQVAQHWLPSRAWPIPLAQDAMFARGMTSLGDLDGDGVQDLAIGSVGDDDGDVNAGAVWIVFMNANRSMKSSQKISELSGGLVADLKMEDGFGRALAGIGDLDGDGIPDLAVGANEDDTGDYNAGAVYVLFLTRQGTVRAQHKITALSGDALEHVPAYKSSFGASIAGMGDIDGDGIPDMAVGARRADSVQVCFLRRDGTVRGSRNIAYGLNGFTDTADDPPDYFGMSCANMGDFDRDGVNDLLIGAFGREKHLMQYVGGQYLMLLNGDGTVKRWFYYGYDNLTARTQTLGIHYNLGTSCAGLGDVDGDGVLDLATGAQREGAISGLEREDSSTLGAVYVLLLNANGTIKTCQRIGDRAGGFDLRLDSGTRWGESLAALGDWDGNGLTDVAVGSRFAFNTGAVYFCELRGESPELESVRADFSATPVSGEAPLTVQFTDLSTGPGTAWSWEFGDGTASSLRDPSHTYPGSGTFSVGLTVRGAGGASDVKLLADLVSVSPVGGLPEGVIKLGCGVNPPTSFQLLAGSPRIGTSMTFGVDNPLGTQAPGSIPLVIASWTPPSRMPCGKKVPRRGMSGPLANGELLIGGPASLSRRGSPWIGPGNPARVVLQFPDDPSLLGRTLYVQGRLRDSSPRAAIPLAFADGFALTFQP